MKKLFASLVLALLLPISGAFAQSACPTIVTGAVLTAAQWNACFSAKQNVLGFTPLNKAGDFMLGKLTTLGSTTGAAGFNLPHGTAPISPVNGDVWSTTAGLFARVNGSTVGPFISTGSAPVTSVFGRSGAVVAVTNDYSFSQISGSVAATQLPNPSATTLGGVKSLAALSNQFLTSIGTNGTPTQAQPSAANLSNGTIGSGAVVLSTSPTLTTPVISSIVNTGTLTLPTSTDTLVGKATTDTLTNKTLTSPVLNAPTFSANAVPNTALAQMPANTIKCNNTGSTANATDCTVAQAQALLQQGTPNFFVSLSASQSVTTATITKVSFDTVAKDSGSYWDTTNKRYTPLVAGTYFFFVGGGANAAPFTAGTSSEFWLSKNGTAGSGGTIVFKAEAYTPAVTADSTSATGGVVLSMNGTTDFVEVDARVTGTTPVVIGSSNIPTYLSGYRIGP